jgi:hypothetical protein
MHMGAKQKPDKCKICGCSLTDENRSKKSMSICAICYGARARLASVRRHAEEQLRRKAAYGRVPLPGELAPESAACFAGLPWGHAQINPVR